MQKSFMNTNLHLVAIELRYRADRLRSLIRFDILNTRADYPDSIDRMLHMKSIVEDCKDIISELLQSK